MKFIIENKVFEILDNLCVALVIAEGINNIEKNDEISSIFYFNIFKIGLSF